MSISELRIDCREARIEGVRYGLITVIADDVDTDCAMKAIKQYGDIDEALDCLSEQDVIAWLEHRGYTITEDNEAA